MIPTPVRGLEAHVNCGPCQACCHQAVILTDEETGYETETIGTARFLKRRPDGACVYLSETGCSIHDLRPACCRAFDCGAWWAATPRASRKQIAREGDSHDKRMLREGRRRAR